MSGVTSRSRRAGSVLGVAEALAAAYFVVVLSVYGFSKLTLHQFYTKLHWWDSKVSELDGFQLSWTFYDHSPAYQFFAGAVELTLVILVFFERTRKLGVFIALPFLANLALLNIEYDIGAIGAVINLSIAIAVLSLRHLRDYKVFFWDREESRKSDVMEQRGVRWFAVGTRAIAVLCVIALNGAFIRSEQRIRTQSVLYGAWHLDSAVTSGAEGEATPEEFASGAVWYFDLVTDFGVRVRDSLQFGTYAIDSTTHGIRLALYDLDPPGYHHVRAHGAGLAQALYFRPERLRRARTGRYRLDGNRLIIETTGANPLTLYLRRAA
jgi:hypothetical protein